MAGETVLIIEDSQLNRELATDLLEVAGYVVLEAADAEAGIALAKTEAPSLILMDIALPGMDGLCATQLLRQDPVTCRIPIIALTAHAMKGDAERALAAGCDAYLTKPFDTRALATVVTRMLEHSCPSGNSGDSGLPKAA